MRYLREAYFSSLSLTLLFETLRESALLQTYTQTTIFEIVLHLIRFYIALHSDNHLLNCSRGTFTHAGLFETVLHLCNLHKNVRTAPVDKPVENLLKAGQRSFKCSFSENPPRPSSKQTNICSYAALSLYLLLQKSACRSLSKTFPFSPERMRL